MNKIVSKKFILSTFLPIILFSILAFLIDRVSKELVLIYFMFNPKTLVITSFFSLNLIFNYGISFSFLNSFSSSTVIFISTIALVVLIILFFKIFNIYNFYLKIAIGLIIGSSFGNIYDRFVFGGVIDFLYFHYKNFGFPIFNSADVLITFSAIILFIHLWVGGKKH